MSILTSGWILDITSSHKFLILGVNTCLCIFVRGMNHSALFGLVIQ